MLVRNDTGANGPIGRAGLGLSLTLAAGWVGQETSLLNSSNPWLEAAGVVGVTTSLIPGEGEAVGVGGALLDKAAGEGFPEGEQVAGQVFRHYANEVGRAGIEREGSIMPGATGRVYVTTDEYASGEAAQSGLALSRTPTGYFEVPGERLPGLQGPRPVEAANGMPGGGTEFWVEQAVKASGLGWFDLP